MKQYKLLTPGPLTTTDTVKEEIVRGMMIINKSHKRLERNCWNWLM